MSCEGCRAAVTYPNVAGCLCDTRDIEAFVEEVTENGRYVVPFVKLRIPVSDAHEAFVIVTLADAMEEMWAA